MAALAVATQVDGVGVDVDVHEVVHDLALDVVLHPVHQEAAAHVDHLDERAVPGENQQGAMVRHYMVYISIRPVVIISRVRNGHAVNLCMLICVFIHAFTLSHVFTFNAYFLLQFLSSHSGQVVTVLSHLQ